MADNFTAGVVPIRSRDLGGQQAQVVVPHDSADAEVFGLVTANPAANTVLGRLKAIADGITALSGNVDGLEGLATALNGFVDGLEALLGTTNTTLTSLAGYTDGLEGLQTATTAAVSALSTPDYEAVAADTGAAVLGAGGAAGDLLAGVLIIPASTSPGAVSIKDGAGGADMVLFAGGADSVATLHPFFVPFGAVAASAGWRLTTGANVSAIAVGNFT